ncbi:MAG TPA: hypothetical protein VHT91_41745 [Kofleriaceae bacterium]|jgi:hypothetical protein|nr:hypothetical protein [Kofleriaceae bacterium]
MLCLNARLAATVLALSLAAGCGLISSDVTNFDLTLPDKKFSIDASAWQVDTTNKNLFSNGTLTSVPCTSTSSVCSSAVADVCPSDCSGKCDPATSACQLSLDVSRPLKVDLLTEEPDLKTINDQPVIKVSIDSVTYAVTANNLNVDTPMISVYVAPLSALKPGDAQAKLIGTIPPIPAMTTSDFQALTFTPTGKADLITFMSNFKTPFNVLVGSSLVIRAGQMLPMGKLDAVVRIRGHAGL